MVNRFSFRNLYLYGICTITLLMALYGLIQLVQHIVNLVIPESLPANMPDSPVNQSAFDKRGIVNNIAQIVITVPVYLYHWRQARRFEQ